MKDILNSNILRIIVCLIIGFSASYYINKKSDNSIVSDLQVELVGEKSYELGDIAEFEATVKNQPENLEKIVAWKVINQDKIIKFRLLSNGNIIFPVGIKPTKINVLMHLAYIDPQTKKLSGSDFLSQEVVVGNNNPEPPTPPTPPVPQPEPKDGKYQIAVFVYKNAKELVKDGNVAVAAKALSDGYSLTAKEILKNQYTTLKDVYSGLKTNNINEFNKVGANPDYWQNWEKEIQKRIAFLNANHQLPKLSDHADLFMEIADGLKYVK